MEQERTESRETDVLPLERYIRAVSICNNLALLASQGSVSQFLQRVAILTRLQRYWTKGYDSVELSCTDITEDNGSEDGDAGISSLVPVTEPEEWEAQSDSTVDLKPDVSGLASEHSEAESERNADDGDSLSNNKQSKASDASAKPKYVCSECGETFRFQGLLKKHTNAKHKRTDQPAEQSTDKTKDIYDPSVGVKKEPIEINSSCSEAATAAYQSAPERHPGLVNFVDHLVNNSARLLSCVLCNKQFSNLQALRRHERWRHASLIRDAQPGHFSCADCGKSFKLWSSVRRHRRNTHMRREVAVTPTPKKSTRRTHWTCFCGKHFNCQSKLKRHELIHNNKKRPEPVASSGKIKNCMCSTCGRFFASSSTLASHIRTHTGERPYVCRFPGCGKRFVQDSTLKYHECTHTDVTPHVCPICGRQFKHPVLVKLHMRVHSDARPYSCSDCGAAFRRLSELQRHVRTHTGEKPYACPDCPMRFKDNRGLRKHERAVHAMLKPFSCPLCNKTFSQSGNMRIHMRTHTGEKPYICATCGIKFSHSGTLKGHMQTHQQLKVH